ncbi:hypothetical protein BH20ACT9_BH20ACT9_02700 [soil metagenome]
MMRRRGQVLRRERSSLTPPRRPDEAASGDQARRLRSTALWAVAVAVLLAGPLAPAGVAKGHPTAVVAQAAAALRTDPVYVHPDAEPGLSPAAAEELRAAIVQADAGPVYVAVLPADAALAAGGDTGQLLEMIGEQVGRRGTYTLVAGRELVAGATDGTPFAPGVVPDLADDAVATGGSPAAVLAVFVEGLAQAADPGADPGGAGGFPWLLLLLVVGAGVALLVRRRQRRRQDAEQLEEVRGLALDDLVALGEEVRALELDADLPGADENGRREYLRALACYSRATEHLDDAARPRDLEEVTTAIEEGRFAAASARAHFEGREPPEHRAPCFFDPRHGVSVRDVEWAPPGGTPRDVPACAADAARVEAGDEPLARTVSVGGRPVPYWNAPAFYGPWAGGYFGGYTGGLLPGLLVGSMLGQSMGLGTGYGPGGYDTGGGDFGGGDFGGGDF